ncbi:hypothetical protein GCK32_017057 [Trichostrongylus colubriformis]|uniref:Peptidase A2 domain-containing protein n=1 Tax=Trichostrongylus colubriformis TaxID=6319 RepID=A0AAN8FWZ0_TRICO
MLVDAKAYNHNAKTLHLVTLLLNSGAQNSFITTSTAKHLCLSIVNQKARTFVIFGGHETTEMTGIVEVTLVDSQNDKLTLQLTLKDTITLPQVPPRLPEVDIDFIKTNGLQLPSNNTSHPVTPNILIGINNYWDIFTQEPPLCLPSGMVLTHTRFGTVVSGSLVFCAGYRKAQKPTQYTRHRTQTKKQRNVSGHSTL